MPRSINCHLLLKASVILCCLTSAAAWSDAWNAKVIGVSVKDPSVGYQEVAGEAGEKELLFKDADDVDVLHWKGIKNPVFVDGLMRFETLNGGELIWGDFSRAEPKYGDLGIGSSWWKHGWPWVVKVRMKQSVQAAKWTLEAAYTRHNHVRSNRKTVKVEGTEIQTIQFNMKTVGWEDVHALKLITDADNATIELESIEVVRPSLPRTFWKKVNLDETPKRADIIFGASGMIEVYVNNSKVASHSGRHPFSRRVNRLEISEYLHVGENTICAEMEGYVSHSGVDNPGREFFFLEGNIVQPSGEAHRISTDQSWSGVPVTGGCSKTEQLEAEPAKVLGSVQKKWFALKGVGSHNRLAEPPYFGPIGLDIDNNGYPYYSESRNINVGIDVSAFDTGAKGNSNVKYQLNRWRQNHTEQAVVVASGEQSADKESIGLGRLKPGSYELVLELVVDNKTVDRRIEELIVVGKIDQEHVAGVQLTNGLNMRAVSNVDFVKDMGEEILCGVQGSASRFSDESVSVDTLRTLKAGADNGILSLPHGRHSWCSIKLSVENLYKPHLLEVEYPYDQESNLIFVLSEDTRYRKLHNLRQNEGIVRLNSGIHTDGSQQGAGVARYIYWPNQREVALTIVNADTGILASGHVDKVTLYEIDNGLPAWNGVSNRYQDLYIGPFVERVDRTTPRMFYAGNLEAKFSRDQVDGYFSGYYSAWYETISNLIKYLKFSGQNTYFAGIYMYHGGWFPSERFQGNPTSGVDDLPIGWRGGAIELMAMMFEENDLNLVLGVEFIGSRHLQGMDHVSDSGVIQGNSTIRFVSDSGRQVRGFQGLGYNFLIPEVQKEMLALADEIGSRFSGYPAVKGVTWMRMPEFPAAESASSDYAIPMNVGYGDYTIARYIEETNSRLPSFDEHEAERFLLRKKWLLENEKGAWQDWRSRKVREMDVKLHETLAKHRSDMKYWHIVSLRSYPGLLRAWGDGVTDNAEELYRAIGIETHMYNNQYGPRLMFLKDVGVSRKYARNKSTQAYSEPADRFYDDGYFRSTVGGSDVLVNIGFMVETTLKTNKQWPWQRLQIVGNSLPANYGILDGLNVSSVPVSGHAVAIGWSDSGHFSGYERQTREFLNIDDPVTRH